MNKFIIPPSPNWYESSVLACAPDNTLIYGSRSDIVIILPTSEDCPSNIRIISRAHSQRITSVSTNKNWGKPNKLAVTVSEDKIIKLWNMDTMERSLSHNEHITHDRVVGAVFAGEDRVISVSENGIVVVWNTILKETNVLKNLFGMKITVTCISTCPHASWLTAFGLKSGLVIVADLRKNGKILHKLRGHDKSVISLSWCPVPVNIFPKNPRNYVGSRKVDQDSVKFDESEVAEEKYDDKVYKDSKMSVLVKKNAESIHEETVICNEVTKVQVENTVDEKKTEKNPEVQKKTVRKLKNPWANLVYSDDEDKPDTNNDALPSVESDFLAECLALKSKIIGHTSNESKTTENACHETKENRPLLKAIKRKTEEPKVNTKDDTAQQSVENIAVSSSVITENVPVKEDNATLKDIDAQPTNTNTKVDESITPSAVENNLTCEDVGRSISAEPVSEQEEPRKEFLLATSAKESNIYIWRAGTDGRMQTFLLLPTSKVHHRKGIKSNEKLWITLCWVKPNKLLCSSKSNELMEWTLPKPNEITKQFRVIHKDHSSLLFSISAPIFYTNELNWTEDSDVNAWTVGMDRLLLNTSLGKDRKNLNCYPTLGGCVSCFASSMMDPNRIAFGTGDGTVNVWDLSRPHVKNIAVTIFYQKIQSKVTSLAWHPSNELLLAYGTVEGRVGIINAGNKSKSPTVLSNYFKTQIHKAEWGPLNTAKDDFALYIVAEGKVVIYDAKKPQNEPVELETPDNTVVYTFAWKLDFNKLLVSTKSGAVLVYSTDLQIMCTYYLQQKLQSIVWHPDSVSSDTTISVHCNCFAAIEKSTECIIYDIGDHCDQNNKKIIGAFSAHGVINSISWSPHDGNKIVFVTEEGVAQIYDIDTKNNLSTYMSPRFESLLAVMWSPFNRDFVLTGSSHHTLEIWKVSENAPLSQNEIAQLRTRTLKSINKETSDLQPKSEIVEDVKLKLKKNSKPSILPYFYSPKDTAEVVVDLKKMLLWKSGNNSVEQIGDKNDGDILDIFGNSTDMTKIIEKNQNMHKQKGKFVMSSTLSLFKGDVSEDIKEAIEQKRVTPHIISLAPMVSPRLWQTACEVYAGQLQEESDSDPHEIVSYLLACHKVDKAINVFCDNQLFREALALAKLRNMDDSKVHSIIEQWGKYASATGNFELAAQCYIYLEKYEDAASVLFRRSDVDILYVAAELAEKSGNQDLYKAVMFRYNAFKAELAQASSMPGANEKINRDSLEKSPENTLDKNEPTKINDISGSDEAVNREMRENTCNAKINGNYGKNETNNECAVNQGDGDKEEKLKPNETSFNTTIDTSEE